MPGYLTPLRYGQQFQLLEEGIGVSPYTNLAECYYYNLLCVPNASAERICKIDPSDCLVVDDAYWAHCAGWGLVGGWSVRAFRLSDRKIFGFIQRIEEELWHSHWPGHPEGQSTGSVTTVADVQWPKPTPESLMWAVEALCSEQVPGSRRATFRPASILALSEHSLLEGLPRALVLLKEWRVPDPEVALHERGFQV